MSFNGSPFVEGSTTPSNNQAFQSDVKAYVGGGSPSDGFFGSVFEVIVFDTALNDAEASEVMTYLASKWSVPKMPRKVNLESAPPLSAIKMSDDKEEIEEEKEVGVGGGGSSLAAQVRLIEKRKKEEELVSVVK